MTETQPNDNLKIWNAVKHPPQAALRAITGGRLKGKTDINPQWRYQAMTEQFGPCGTGWTWELKRIWNEPVGDGQIFAFAEVAVTYKQDNAWSLPIVGIGGSMLVEKESAGLHASDEGYKMAITDALSTALKLLGVGADVYLGQTDGGKYKSPPGRPTAPPAASNPLESKPGAAGGIVGGHQDQDNSEEFDKLQSATAGQPRAGPATTEKLTIYQQRNQLADLLVKRNVRGYDAQCQWIKAATGGKATQIADVTEDIIADLKKQAGG